MLSKFIEATRLLYANLRLFSSIILTVWIPGNLFSNYLTYYVFGEEDILETFRITGVIEGIFGPIYIAAMIYTLSQLKQGHHPSYSEANEASPQQATGYLNCKEQGTQQAAGYYTQDMIVIPTRVGIHRTGSPLS